MKAIDDNDSSMYIIVCADNCNLYKRIKIKTEILLLMRKGSSPTMFRLLKPRK